MREKVPIKNLNVFRITEEPEEPVDTEDNNSQTLTDNRQPTTNNHIVLEELNSLKAEIVKLGRSQLQTRMFAKSEYQALREAIDANSNNNHIAEMVIEDLFSIADGLEAGTQAGEEISHPEMSSWFEGLKIVHQRVMDLLEKFDIRPIDSLGRPFDPSLHIAVDVQYEQEIGDNIILKEQRRGYMRGNKVIRYTEVVVNKYIYETEEQVEESNE